eukprot:8798257-Pyramimonas_sp.AAC.1
MAARLDLSVPYQCVGGDLHQRFLSSSAAASGTTSVSQVWGRLGPPPSPPPGNWDPPEVELDTVTL